MTDTDTARRLRTAGRKVREWTDERNSLIVDAREQGMSLREIAELVGLSHNAVAKIETKWENTQ